jgi:hypothetical protein
LNFDLPAEDVLEVDDDGEMNDWWTMYFDEVVHVSGNRAATVIIHPKKKQYHVFSKVIGWMH